MTLIIVEHDAWEPALHGAMAAVVAGIQGARICQFEASFDTDRYPDAVQHVAAAGALVASGLVTYERLTGGAVDPNTTIDNVLRHLPQGDIVVPLHHGSMPQRDTIAELQLRTAAVGVPIKRIAVATDGSGMRFIDPVTGWHQRELGLWTRDVHSRLRSAQDDPVATTGGIAVRVGLVGTPRDHRDVYPAALTALADAADAEGVDLTVVFIDPPSVRPQDLAGIGREIDGILLPGGADMVNVPGQILMATEGLRTRLPTLGLCLGMQTMTTAVIQRALGSATANLEEADPTAPIKTFIPLASGPGPQHRLGDRTMRTDPGSRLAGLLGVEALTRYNHRYHLNPALFADAQAAGLRISGFGTTGVIADAVEHSGHPFFIGLQGHPELSSRPSFPHPLILDFVAACVASQR